MAKDKNAPQISGRTSPTQVLRFWEKKIFDSLRDRETNEARAGFPGLPEYSRRTPQPRLAMSFLNSEGSRVIFDEMDALFAEIDAIQRGVAFALEDDVDQEAASSYLG